MEDASKGLSEAIELYISCQNLPDKDTFSKSDPIVKVTMETRGKGNQLVGMTETQKNNLNPVFKKCILVNYYFEQHQTLSFLCVDVDETNIEGDQIGTANCTIAQIMMTDPETGLKLPLDNSKKNSFITIKYQRLPNLNMDFIFKVKCQKVKNLRWCGKSKPFLRISRPGKGYEDSNNPEKIPDANWIIVNETEWPVANLEPVFAPFTIKGSVLNRGNISMKNKWELWDHSTEDNHKYIGGAFISVKEIQEEKRIFPSENKSKNFTGDIIFDECKTVKKHSILDYLKMGLNLSLTVGIDFTASNGGATNPTSLHYILGPRPNQYQSTLTEVGMILLEYDTDKLVPMYGFGASPPGEKQTSFCFPLNLLPKSPFVYSVPGLLETYSSIVGRLNFLGPTNFAPIMAETMDAVARGYKTNKMVYSILLILTDGLITDFQETKKVLVKCSRLPMSVIIVGVGNEDFSQMEMLDSDKSLLKDSDGNTAVRDIVQFVPYRDFASNPSLLSETVLKELPGQIDQFYQSIGVIPPS